MSDYFGALLRSAGALPGSGPARGTVPKPMGIEVADGAAHASEMAFEQSVEVEAPPVLAVPAVAGFPTAAPRSPQSTAIPTPEPRTAPESAPGLAIAALPARQRDARTGEFGRAATDEPVHPRVQAALQWVRADAWADEARAPDAAREQPARRVVDLAPPLAQPVVAALHEPVQDIAPRATTAPAPATGSELPGDVAHPSGSFDLDLPRSAVPTGASRRAATDDERLAPVTPPRIELSIGTIHVRVDAPPAPRPVVQAMPPAPRPPAAARPSTTRNSLSRSRLPRF